MPDAAFIGGSGGALYETLSVLKERNPKVRVVISAVSLETLADAQIALETLNFAQVNICQLSAVREQQMEDRAYFAANNPIFLLSGGGRG